MGTLGGEPVGRNHRRNARKKGRWSWWGDAGPVSSIISDQEPAGVSIKAVLQGKASPSPENKTGSLE